MTTLPWDVLLERCTGASEAIIAAPYIKVDPLTSVIDRLDEGASVTCFTRWTPTDIHIGASDLNCRTVIVERGGAFGLHNRLHAKYYRFDDQVLVGSANMTASGLNYPRTGNLEILCEPGPTFDPGMFENSLKRESKEVSDDDFKIWQLCSITEQSFDLSSVDIFGAGLDDWIPHTRNPGYLWLYYTGDEAQIASVEQRILASLDLKTLNVPDGLTLESFRYWIYLSLQSSPFMDLARYFGGQTDTIVWDSVADKWGVSRSIAARWMSTAYNWMKYFDLGG